MDLRTMSRDIGSNGNQVGQTYFKYLDSLRAFAALAVFGYHCLTEFHIASNSFLGRILNKGDLGVILFYMLSGFVIFSSLERLKQANPSGSFDSLLKKFWLRRFLRIYPLYIFSIVTVYLLDPSVSKGLDRYNLLTHIFGIHSFFRDYHGSINGVLWTLSLELQFYFIAPFLFVILSKISNLALFISSISIWVISYFFSRTILIEGLACWGTGGANRIDSWSFFMGLNQLPNVLVFFLLGYLAFRRRHKELFLPLVNLAVFLLIVYFFESHLASLLTPTCDIYCFNYIRQLVYASGFYFVIRLLTCPGTKNNLFSIFQPVFEWLGKISYGIYIWHLLIIRFVQQTMLTFSNTHNVIVSLCATIIIADFSYRYIESRFMNLGKSSR